MHNIFRAFAGLEEALLIEQIGFGKLELVEQVSKSFLERVDLLGVSLGADGASDSELAALEEVEADLGAEEA